MAHEARDLDDEHRRPPDADDTTIAAAGKVCEALETVERARGHLYSFHQLTGTADRRLGEAVGLLRAAGHTALAELVERELIGRNVVPGRWTFQLLEEYNRTYYRPFADIEERIRERLTAGREHVFEAEMKRAAITPGHPDHTPTP